MCSAVVLENYLYIYIYIIIILNFLKIHTALFIYYIICSGYITNNNKINTNKNFFI